LVEILNRGIEKIEAGESSLFTVLRCMGAEKPEKSGKTRLPQLKPPPGHLLGGALEAMRIAKVSCRHDTPPGG